MLSVINCLFLLSALAQAVIAGRFAGRIDQVFGTKILGFVCRMEGFNSTMAEMLQLQLMFNSSVIEPIMAEQAGLFDITSRGLEGHPCYLPSAPIGYVFQFSSTYSPETMSEYNGEVVEVDVVARNKLDASETPLTLPLNPFSSSSSLVRIGPPQCGNGVLDDGESCDNGILAGNTEAQCCDESTCTMELLRPCNVSDGIDVGICQEGRCMFGGKCTLVNKLFSEVCDPQPECPEKSGKCTQGVCLPKLPCPTTGSPPTPMQTTGPTMAPSFAPTQAPLRSTWPITVVVSLEQLSETDRSELLAGIEEHLAALVSPNDFDVRRTYALVRVALVDESGQDALALLYEGSNVCVLVADGGRRICAALIDAHSSAMSVPSTAAESNTMLMVIVGSVGGAILLLMAICFCLLIRKREVRRSERVARSTRSRSARSSRRQSTVMKHTRSKRSSSVHTYGDIVLAPRGVSGFGGGSGGGGGSSSGAGRVMVAAADEYGVMPTITDAGTVYKDVVAPGSEATPKSTTYDQVSPLVSSGDTLVDRGYSFGTLSSNETSSYADLSLSADKDRITAEANERNAILQPIRREISSTST